LGKVRVFLKYFMTGMNVRNNYGMLNVKIVHKGKTKKGTIANK